MNSRYWATPSAVPANLARRLGRWVAMPAGQVSLWQARTMMQPSASISAVPKEYSSAPSSAAIMMSRPVFMPPSTRTPDPVPEIVVAQGPLRVGQAELPRHAGVLDGGQRRRARSAVAAGDHHDVGQRLDDTGGDGADPVLGHELDRHVGHRVDLLEVVDELGQVLDGVDVVVGRRGDQAHTGLGVAQAGDLGRHLVARQVPALAGLGPLGHLDVELVGEGAVLRRHAEAAGGDLLDPGVDVGGRVPGPVAVAALAALAAVVAGADHVEGQGQRLVGLGRQGAV